MNKKKFKNIFIENNEKLHNQLILYNDKKKYFLYQDKYYTYKYLFEEFFFFRYKHLLNKRFFYIKFLPNFIYFRNNFFFRKFFLFFVKNFNLYYNYYINLYNIKKVYFRAYDSECTDFIQDSIYYEFFYKDNDYVPKINYLHDFICDKYFFERFNSINFHKSIFLDTKYNYTSDILIDDYNFFFIRSKLLYKKNIYYNNSLLFLPIYNNLLISDYFMLNEEKEKNNPLCIFLKYNVYNDFFILNNMPLIFFNFNLNINIHEYNIYKFFLILINNNN